MRLQIFNTDSKYLLEISHFATKILHGGVTCKLSRLDSTGTQCKKLLPIPKMMIFVSIFMDFEQIF